jgi:uncharacterized repeat protein (TIGR01451 family)
MKKILSLCFAFGLCIISYAQTINSSGSTISVDTTNSPYPVVPKPPNTDNSSAHDTSIRTVVWVETGDGFFATQPISESLKGTQNHAPFMFRTNLYDTTKENLVNYSVTRKGNAPPTKYYIPLSTKQPFIKITPNAYDIVPGTPTMFALTYKAPQLADNNTNSDTIIAPSTKTAQAYKLYFFYNNNRTFNVIDGTQNNVISLSATSTIAANRIHNGEVISYNATLPSRLAKPDGCSNWVCYTFTPNNQYGKNVFLTFNSPSDLELGKSGSVYAILTDNSGNKLAADSIVNMRFAPAHDPNYIIQRPYCLRLPKKENLFTYTIHFQNTGGGDAKEVKVVAQLPKGMSLSSFSRDSIKAASFAGINYKNRVQFLIIKAKNQIIFTFLPSGKAEYLRGTSVAQPATNPLTMGEVTFTLKSTPDTEKELAAFADIYFRSEYPSSNITAEGYEKPVMTDTVVTKYRDDCTCRDCPDPSPTCCKIFWLCWWWWILIITIILILWFILRKRRKKKENTIYQ